MISWISIVKTALSIFDKISEYFRDRQLIKAGESKAKAESNEKALEAIRKGQLARSSVKHDPDSVQNDPNRRD